MAQVTVNTPNMEDAIGEQLELAVSPTKEKVKIDGEEIAGGESEIKVSEVVIRTGANAAEHLLPLRDDFGPVVTFRSIVLATVLSKFQSVMNQIYAVSPHSSLVGVCYGRLLTPSNSSSQPRLPFREHLLSSFHILWAMRGPSCFPVVRSSRLGGGTRTVRTNFPGGSRPSSLSIIAHGVLRSTQFVQSRLHRHRMPRRRQPCLQPRTSFTTCR